MKRPQQALMRSFGVLLLAVLAACSVAESQRFSVKKPVVSQAMFDEDAAVMAYASAPCTSPLGSYALPKAFLHIKIGQKDANTPPEIMPGAGDAPIEVVRRADNSLVFCLDHLSSAFADEKISVSKWPADKTGTEKGSLLSAVMVNVTDQTAFIVRAFLRTLFIGITGKPDFRSALTPEQIVADLEIDPFDQRDMAVANARLTKLGYCVVLKDFGFPSDVSVQNYCSAPLVHGMQLTQVSKAYAKAATTAANPHLPGVMYRPRMPYRLLLFHKRDPKGRGPWLLSQMINVELENLSPVLSLGIDRGVFSGKNVNFIFSEGTLQHACVSKSSELEGFVAIPLEIAKSIVSVPASIVAVRINQIDAKKQLAGLERQLFQIQRVHLAKLAGEEAEIPGDLPGQKDFAAIAPGDFDLPDDLKKDIVGAPKFDSHAVCTPGATM